MLTQYKNIKEIETSKGSVSGDRLVRTKKEFLSYDAQETYYANKEILKSDDSSKIEFHVYSGNNWITGNHKINYLNKIPNLKGPTGKLITTNSAIGIDVFNELQSLKLTTGNFKFVINTSHCPFNLVFVSYVSFVAASILTSIVFIYGVAFICFHNFSFNKLPFVII